MKQIIYQMLPRLWGSGRFSSVNTKAFHYLKALGVDWIWMTGIIRHASVSSGEKVVKGNAGSPYAITDYYDVNPYLADDPSRRMEEFEDLIRRTHAHGFKLIIDFVPNHVAREYSGSAASPLIPPLGEGDDRSVHWKAENDFFYYPGQALELPLETAYREIPARASGNCFSASPGINDWWETVKINYCDFPTATWDKMYAILRFWALKGVDGFRCDMVELVPPAFMKWAIESIRREFPHILFIAEVYAKEQYRFYAEEVGFDLLYDKSGLYDTLRSVLTEGTGAERISWNWQFLSDLQSRMLNFLENHDEQRLASDFFASSPQRGYAALAVSLLLNDAPFMLYFGQEAGERGMQAEGYSGMDGRTSIFDFCTVPALEKPDEAVLRRYREWINLSHRPAFSSGKTFDLGYLQEAGFDRQRHFAFLRSDGKECWIVVANFSSGQSRIHVRIPPQVASFLGMEPLDDWEGLVPGQDACVSLLGSPSAGGTRLG